jgi:hypothetical protein
MLVMMMTAMLPLLQVLEQRRWRRARAALQHSAPHCHPPQPRLRPKQRKRQQQQQQQQLWLL